MADASADRANVVRSLIIWAVALVAAILVAFVVGGLLGLGAAPGLVFGGRVFVVLPYLIPARAARGPRRRRPAGHDRAAAGPRPSAARSHEPSGAGTRRGARRRAGSDDAAHADRDLPVAPDGPGALSERVREAARAAGEAARAAAGDACVRGTAGGARRRRAAARPTT